MTTIKLIRYSDTNENMVPGTTLGNTGRNCNNLNLKNDSNNSDIQQQQQQQKLQQQETNIPTPMESETSSSLDNSPSSCDSNLPTDLRK